MDDEQLSGEVLEVGGEPDGLDEALESWLEPEDDPYFSEESPEGGDAPEGEESLDGEETPEDDEPLDDDETQEETPEDEVQSPDVVEWDGQEYSVPELVQEASFGRQAVGEVLQLREQMSFIDEYAALSGMGRGDYLSALRGQLEQARVAKVAAEHDVTPEAAGQLIAEKRRREQAETALQRQQSAMAQQQQRQAEMAPWMELLRRFPELHDKSKLPPEVAGEISRGAHPVVAYQDYMLRTQQHQSRVHEQRQTVKAKSPGSATGVGDGAIDDEALAAFDAVMNGFI